MSMSISNADADHYADDNIVNATKHVGAKSLLGPTAANVIPQSTSYSTLGVAPAGVAQQSPVSPRQETPLRNG